MRTKLTELAGKQNVINRVFVKFGFEYQGVRERPMLKEAWLWRKVIGILHPVTKQHYPIYAVIKREVSDNYIVEFHYQDIDESIKTDRVELKILVSYYLPDLDKREFTLEKLNAELEEYVGLYVDK